MKKLLLSIFVFVAISQISFAQPLREVPYRMMIEAGETAYENQDYYNALEWFEKAYKESRDKDIGIKIAKSHMEMRDYKKASTWYNRIIERDKAGLYDDYKYEYGKSLKMMGDFPTAHSVLTEFVQESQDEDRRSMAMLEIMGIEKSSELEDNLDANIKLGPKGINSRSSESGPVAFGDEIYYSSLNRKEILVEGEKSEGDTHFKIYTSKLGDKGYGKGVALSEEVNREDYHTTHPSISVDGSRMYYIRTIMEEGEVLESKLYYSKRVGDNWGPGDEVNGINGDYFIKHPAVGELYGKKVLFFTSDMEGGFGGLDIYYAENTGGDSYGTPINLGPSINSSYDEITPFYKDGTLYFSSTGRPGLGGFDIYTTEWDGVKWSTVKNLGNGYNSTFDDFSYTMNADGLQGFLVSNRPAEGKRSLISKTCCDDIFLINIRQVVIDLLALVTDENGELNGAEVTLIDLTEGPEKNSPESKTNMGGNNFSYGLDQDKSYKVVVKREGYYPDSLEFNTVGILDDYTVNKSIKLEPIPEPEPEVVEETVEIVTINKAFRLGNIYYDFDDDKILLDAEKDLNTILGLMGEYSDMVIELSSHTDSQGTSTYNKKLSQRRADSAKQWLVTRGVASERIQAVGYGEDVILNQCVNGTRCSDEEHRYNRRTEFKIISGPTSIEIRTPKTSIPSNNGGGMPMSYDQNNTPETTLKFEANEYQLGDVKMGELVDLEYVIVNTGKHDLIIRLVTACNCTTLDYSTDPVKPGEKTTIYATYDGSKKVNGAGQYREAINVICNTPNVVEEAIFHVNVVN